MGTTQDDILVKVGKALQLAENAGTDGERDAAYAQAQRLATKYSIDTAKARAAVEKLSRREQPVMETIDIGSRGQHNLAVFCSLFMEIGRTNDLKFNIAQNSTYVIAFGFPSDIELTKALYASILQQMMQATTEYIKKGDYKNETEYRFNRRLGIYERKPVDTRVAKRSFWQSYTRRIGSRLRDAKQDIINEMTVEEETNDAGQTSTELVLVGKALEVSDFYKQTSTARGSWKGSSATYRSSRASSAGYAAANNASLGGSKSLAGRKAIG